MRIAHSTGELSLDRSKKIGFVPTMGALHEGHLSLIRKARDECELVVVSVFVNPLQFGQGEDFETYPRNEAADADKAGSAGADVVFAPTVKEVYPRPSTKVIVPEVGDRWEGLHRPGHFDGVATVVCKLFNMVGPNVAYFGQKDLQQCAVVRRMVEDLNMPIELRFCATLREADGLAMSSRNVYLDPDERQRAPQLYANLQSAVNALRESSEDVQKVLSEARSALERVGFSIDYFSLVDPVSLAPLTSFATPSALIAAARLGKTRLIDNIVVVK